MLFIELLPKKKELSESKIFGCIYVVVAMLFVERIKKVISQNAFVAKIKINYFYFITTVAFSICKHNVL